MILHPERRFYFALAEKLGMTVGELLRRMSSLELTEWMAYYRVKAAEEEQAAMAAKLARG